MEEEGIDIFLRDAIGPSPQKQNSGDGMCSLLQTSLPIYPSVAEQDPVYREGFTPGGGAEETCGKSYAASFASSIVL